MTLGTVLTIAHQLAEVAVPVVIGVVIDRAVITSDTGALVLWTVVLAGLFGALSAAGCVGLYVEERAVTGATHQTRLLVARRALHPAGGIESTLPGQVVSLSSVEAARIGEGVGALILGLGALAGVIAASVVLLATSVTLGLVVMLGLPVLMVAVQALTAPLTAKAEAQQAAVGAASGMAADLFSGLRVLKGLRAEAAAASRYRRSSQTALGAALDANRVRAAYLGITLTAAGGFLAVITWVGGRQALDGSVSVGQLVAALGITQFLIGPLGRLAFLAGVLAQARASDNRIGEALGARPSGASAAQHPGDGNQPPQSSPPDSSLALDSLTYQSLAGVDVSVDAGQIVGLAAADPADGAALVACLDGSAVPESGQVTVGKVPLRRLGMDDARARLLVAHHDARLFEGDLRDNITSAAQPTQDLTDVLVASGADEVAAALPGGLDMQVSDAGRSLSGGQRQRVALARALATDPPILVLHDPTTAVDAATEHRIAVGLRSLRSGRSTTVLVTTSPVLLAATDRVALLDGGRVVAEGTHDELAAGHSRYQEVVLG